MPRYAWAALLAVGILLPHHVLLAIGGPVPPAKKSTPPELGQVSWLRDYDRALGDSAASGRPVFLLFQEVPGCATCVTFGKEPLSHPLLVEAVEDEFVPLAIFNNRPGHDAKIRERYGEPSWNFPVIRFLDAEEKDLLPRRDRVWTTAGVAGRMVSALEKAGRDVPGYLAVVAAEHDRKAVETATFAMHCYWEGEARLGRLDGVIGSRCGWVEGREVVEVDFDTRTLSYDRLVVAAAKAHCDQVVYTRNQKQRSAALAVAGDRVRPLPGPMRPAKPTDQKHTLGRSPLRHLPLTPMQATKVNAALRLGGDVRSWLSPRQTRRLAGILAGEDGDRE